MIYNDFIKYICDYLTFDHLGEKLYIDYSDPEMKDFTVNAGVFDYENNEFKIDVNCRYPKGWDKDSAFLNIAASAKKYHFKHKIQ